MALIERNYAALVVVRVMPADAIKLRALEPKGRKRMGATFRELFGLITGHAPFPWQEKLYGEFLEKRFRVICDVPTGLGKTSVIAIWLLALAEQCRKGLPSDFPRRLIYVVNRRTVVDQATDEAERIRTALLSELHLQATADLLRRITTRPPDAPLAISTLRGQFADNAEWRDDPARAAIIVGTVDMIGSRLLFSGYGRGFKTRPLHAGFLGQDALLIHDEAHLEPAFQQLVDAIQREQERCGEFRRFRVMALTATSRVQVDGEEPILDERDQENPEVSKRLHARKTVRLHAVEEKDVARTISDCALAHTASNQAILVFLRKLEDVRKVTDDLRRASLAVQTLTGTMRGFERDRLTTHDPIFARFMPNSKVTPRAGTVYLVCTSAGEVGIDISADHLVCDLVPFDSLAQRLGRVNRFGNGDARIDIVHRITAHEDLRAGDERPGGLRASSRNDGYDRACELTLGLLRRLPADDDRHYQASPSELNELPRDERLAAFTPAPAILPTTDILFDGWALTTVVRLPGRPPVADWLHGVAEWEPPETYVAWREEVELIKADLLELYPPSELLDDYPLKPHELLRDRSDRILNELKSIATRRPELPVWIVGEDLPQSLNELVEAGEGVLRDRIVLLPPSAGGLKFVAGESLGTLDGGAEFREESRALYDISDKWLDIDEAPRRCRVWDDQKPLEDDMRLIRVIDVDPRREDDGDESGQAAMPRYWRWHVRPGSADDDGSRNARKPQALGAHLRSAESFAQAIVEKLGLGSAESSAVILAARWHDLGKQRRIWQRSIRNQDYPELVLAKSGGRMRPLDLSHYRHEFGSLIDAAMCPEFQALGAELRDLVLHFIASHHGRARPHFPVHEAFDPERVQQAADATARAVPLRFARLQKKYGRWGLAYLESLVRAADALASQADIREARASNSAAAMAAESGS
jgi:CRISPR-associated endonuclease/helicase Cas3